MSGSGYAIEVTQLGKRYRLGEQSGSGLLRDALADWWRRRGSAPAPARDSSTLWALHDASFAVRPGEAVGIIGHNGAGKSTLLKLLSRITEPTTGRIRIRGTMASLLEVGTGFHPDLTGRENIFMNGAILGMSRSEIRRKLDEIVAFAGVERFINTPVRRYSSGMAVRLAFAVAAHLEPDILLLDEVLAVGDAEFQRKCMGKMGEVTRKQGRTILFVSHNLASIQQLCQRVLLLRHGGIACDTDASAGIAAYLAQARAAAPDVRGRRVGDELQLAEFSVDPPVVEVFADARFRICLTADLACALHELCLLFHNNVGQRVALVDLRPPSGVHRLEAGDRLELTGRMRRLAFVPGQYSASLFVRSDRTMEHCTALQSVDVLPPKAEHDLVTYGAEFMGAVAVDASVTARLLPRSP